MIKVLVLIPVLTFFFHFSTLAAYYALAPCEDETLMELKKKCSILPVKIVSEVPGHLIVEAERSVLEDEFCYIAEVRQFGQELCFNTRSLFIKKEPSVQVLNGIIALKPHAFIPDLFTYETLAKNSEELDVIKASLTQIDGVDYVGYNQVFTMEASVNDPLYARQWALENTGSALQYSGTPGADMSVNEAWTITTGSAQIKIAVLDSGVDTLHEDLSNNLLPGFDGFGNGAPGTSGHPTPNFDSDGHGTCCAGIIAAEADNGLGIAGVAYSSKIIPVRIFYYVDYGGSIGVQATSTTQVLLDGFSYAWREAGADVLSASAGLNALSILALGIDTALINAELNAAYWEARNWKGIPMFFSSGNDNNATLLWPANLDKTIAVGASSMCDERKSPSDCSGEAWGGNFDQKLDLVAPGVKISTTDMSGSYGYSVNGYTYTFNGTSASCPNAAGVAALILSVNGGLQAGDVRAILNITADRVPGYVYDSISPYGTWNSEMGHGRVNAFAAVQLAQTYVSSVGISEPSTHFQTGVYPNPGTDKMLVLCGEESAEVSVLDIHGKTVIFPQTIGHKQALNVQDLQSGIYFVRISNSHSDSVVQYVKL